MYDALHEICFFHFFSFRIFCVVMINGLKFHDESTPRPYDIIMIKMFAKSSATESENIYNQNSLKKKPRKQNRNDEKITRHKLTLATTTTTMVEKNVCR